MLTSSSLRRENAAPAPALDSLAGYASALPTPFRDGEVDVEAFAAFCEWQIEEGIAALVVAGTTGEAPTLSPEEQRALVRVAVGTAGGRVPVIAGAGANATDHAIALARQAEAERADGLLVVVPYYNRPTQEGLYRHFRAVHDASGLPIVLYDVPARTGCGLTLETVMRLAALPRIVGLKDATADLARPLRLRRLIGDRFRLLSGDDLTALGFLAQGGDGCISVLSNVAPRACVQLHAAWEERDTAAAQAIARALVPLATALFAESNPIPLKYALGRMGHMDMAVRLPLSPAAPATRREIDAALQSLAIVPQPCSSEPGKSVARPLVAWLAE